MLREHDPEMNSSKRNHLLMRMLHRNKDSRSKDKNKNKFYLISHAMKTNLNRIFFMVKRNFISGRFEFRLLCKYPLNFIITCVKYITHTLCKKYLYSGPYFPAFGQNTEKYS